jgi:two-component system response regulator ChvI
MLSTPTSLASVQGFAPMRIQRVIAIDDDDFFREMLTRELAEVGITVDAYADGDSLFAEASSLENAELIILDWSLAQGCGLDLLPQIRKRGINLPVIVLTGRALAAHEILAFDRGATDFIDKAKGIPILVRRLRNILSAKNAAPTVEKMLNDGDLQLRLNVSRGFWKNQDVDLTLSEFRVVHLLASRPGHHIGYREIYDSIRYPGFYAGSGDDGFRTNVRSSVKRIRNKFRQLDPSFDRIENFAGYGYVWKADTGTV